MIYEYTCIECVIDVEIIKPVAQYQSPEYCNHCKSKLVRSFAPKKVHLVRTSVQDAYFHPGLGQVVRGDNHARDIAKEKKLVEVGNENVHKHQRPNVKSYDY